MSALMRHSTSVAAPAAACEAAPSQTARPRRVTLTRLGAAAALTAVAALTPACNRTSGSGAAKDDLATVPRDTAMVFMVNVAQARKTEAWKKLTELRDKDAKSKQQYDDFVKKCSLDPFNQIDSVFVAMPANYNDTKEIAILARGTFNNDALIDCAKKNAQEKSEEVTEVTYNGTKLYGFSKDKAFFAPLGKKLVAVGGPSWIKRVVDLNAGKGESAKDNAELAALIKRTRTGDVLWAAGLVPPQALDRLQNNPQLGAARSMKSASGSIDLTKGFALHTFLDLGSDADAASLATLGNEQLTKLRQMPQLQMMGMASFLDKVTIEAKKNTFVLEGSLTQPQVDDLSTRLAGMAKSFGM